MILVDVVCPELGQTVDFQLDENVPGWDIAEEIAVMIGRSCSRTYTPGQNMICLYTMERKYPLDLNRSLKENGVCSGEQLLFI